MTLNISKFLIFFVAFYTAAKDTREDDFGQDQAEFSDEARPELMIHPDKVLKHTPETDRTIESKDAQYDESQHMEQDNDIDNAVKLLSEAFRENAINRLDISDTMEKMAKKTKGEADAPEPVALGQFGPNDSANANDMEDDQLLRSILRVDDTPPPGSTSTDAPAVVTTRGPANSGNNGNLPSGEQHGDHGAQDPPQHEDGHGPTGGGGQTESHGDQSGHEQNGGDNNERLADNSQHEDGQADMGEPSTVEESQLGEILAEPEDFPDEVPAAAGMQAKFTEWTTEHNDNKGKMDTEVTGASGVMERSKTDYNEAVAYYDSHVQEANQNLDEILNKKQQWIDLNIEMMSKINDETVQAVFGIDRTLSVKARQGKALQMAQQATNLESLVNRVKGFIDGAKERLKTAATEPAKLAINKELETYQKMTPPTVKEIAEAKASADTMAKQAQEALKKLSDDMDALNASAVKLSEMVHSRAEERAKLLSSIDELETLLYGSDIIAVDLPESDYAETLKTMRQAYFKQVEYFMRHKKRLIKGRQLIAADTAQATLAQSMMTEALATLGQEEEARLKFIEFGLKEIEAYAKINQASDISMSMEMWTKDFLGDDDQINEQLRKDDENRENRIAKYKVAVSAAEELGTAENEVFVKRDILAKKIQDLYPRYPELEEIEKRLAAAKDEEKLWADAVYSTDPGNFFFTHRASDPNFLNYIDDKVDKEKGMTLIRRYKGKLNEATARADSIENELYHKAVELTANEQGISVQAEFDALTKAEEERTKKLDAFKAAYMECHAAAMTENDGFKRSIEIFFGNTKRISDMTTTMIKYETPRIEGWKTRLMPDDQVESSKVDYHTKKTAAEAATGEDKLTKMADAVNALAKYQLMVLTSAIVKAMVPRFESRLALAKRIDAAQKGCVERSTKLDRLVGAQTLSLEAFGARLNYILRKADQEVIMKTDERTLPEPETTTAPPPAKPNTSDGKPSSGVAGIGLISVSSILAMATFLVMLVL